MNDGNTIAMQMGAMWGSWMQSLGVTCSHKRSRSLSRCLFFLICSHGAPRSGRGKQGLKNLARKTDLVLGSTRGHPDFSELAQRATSGALALAPTERVLGYAAKEDDPEDHDDATTVVSVSPPAPDARAKSRSGTRVSGARVSGVSGVSGKRVSGVSGKPHPTPRKYTRCPRQ